MSLVSESIPVHVHKSPAPSIGAFARAAFFCLAYAKTGIRIELVRMPDGTVAATHKVSKPSVILGTTAERG